MIGSKNLDKLSYVLDIQQNKNNLEPLKKLRTIDYEGKIWQMSKVK